MKSTLIEDLKRPHYGKEKGWLCNFFIYRNYIKNPSQKSKKDNLNHQGHQVHQESQNND
jgi:hypothetical protein